MGISVVEVYSEPVIVEVIEPEETIEVRPADPNPVRVVEVGIGGYVPDLSAFARLTDLLEILPRNEIWELDPNGMTTGYLTLNIANMYYLGTSITIIMPTPYAGPGFDADAIQGLINTAFAASHAQDYSSIEQDPGITVTEVDGKIRFEYNGLHSRWRTSAQGEEVFAGQMYIQEVAENDATPTFTRVQEGRGLQIDAGSLAYYWDLHQQLGWLNGGHPNVQSMIDSFDDLINQSGLWSQGEWQGLPSTAPIFKGAVVTRSTTSGNLTDGVQANPGTATQFLDSHNYFPQTGKGSLGSAGWRNEEPNAYYRMRGWVNVDGLAAGDLVYVINPMTGLNIAEHYITAEEATAGTARIEFESRPFLVNSIGNQARFFILQAIRNNLSGVIGSFQAYEWELVYLGNQ